MNLTSIQQTISNLITETATFETESFKEKLYCTYRTELLKQLQKCKSAEAFKQALANNWSLVKGNALCYTARPDDPLTILLCEIAEDISQELNIKPIRLLMPGVMTESMYGNNDCAYQHYPNLTDLDLPLKKLLQTHILSDSGSYLIPVRVLLELPDPLADNPNRLGNHYYDLDDETAAGYVTNKEFNRLCHHCVHTQALIKAQEDYKALAKDAGLLSQLKALIDGFRFNSTAGIGSEEAAGQGAYWALAQFNDYYEQLGKAVEDIPLPVKTAIERLNTIASDAAENHVATANTESCANTRQQELSHLLIEHEAVLANIGLDSINQALLLSAARNRIEENKNTLSKLLTPKEPVYAGQDSLGLTHALLKTFDVKPKITSTGALQDFLSLNPDEIKEIVAKEPSVKAGIIRQLPKIEALVTFCLTIPLEPLEAVISVMGKSLCDKLIFTLDDISACLMLMEGPRLKHMMQLLAERLPTLINDACEFRLVLEYLNHEQRSAVYDAFKSKLPTLIECSIDFAAVLQYLSPEQCSAICESIKAQLPTLVKSRNDFWVVLRFLSPDQCTVVCDALKAQLPVIIKDSKDFGHVLATLEPEQISAVCDALKAQLPVIIKYVEDFCEVLIKLDPDQSSNFYESFKAELPNLIKCGYDFNKVLTHLSLEQRSNVYETFKAELPNFIKCGNDFNKVLEHLSLEQRSNIYETFKAELPNLIKCGYNFNKVLEHLSLEQRSNVYESLKAQLPTLIKDGMDFGEVLGYLSPEQRSAVYESLKTQLPTLIKSSPDFAHAIKFLSLEQRSAVYESLKPQLLTIIKSGVDFQRTLEFLSMEQRSAVYEAFKEQLPSLIHNATFFKKVVGYLNADQRMEVFHLFKADLIKKIQQGIPFYHLQDWFASKGCLQDLGYSAIQSQALQEEIRVIMEEEKQNRIKISFPGFENRKRKISEMQETDQNDSREKKLKNQHRGK